MNIAAWLVILSTDGIDEYYVDMAMTSLIHNVNLIYIQDQGCTDRSIDIIKEIVGKHALLIIEQVPTGLPRFHENYNEPLYRSGAIKRCEEVFQPDWMLQIDTDEIYTEHFFTQLQELHESGEIENYNGIRHATERFITPEYRSQSAHALQKIDGIDYYDPHTRLWRAGQGTHYVRSAGQPGFLHCILNEEPGPIKWLPGINHIHLHRSFGPKSVAFWREGGDVFEHCIPFNPRRQAPNWFHAQINMGEAVKTDFKWPDYVLKKWNEWMTYE